MIGPGTPQWGDPMIWDFRRPVPIKYHFIVIKDGHLLFNIKSLASLCVTELNCRIVRRSETNTRHRFSLISASKGDQRSFGYYDQSMKSND